MIQYGSYNNDIYTRDSIVVNMEKAVKISGMLQLKQKCYIMFAVMGT